MSYELIYNGKNCKMSSLFTKKSLCNLFYIYIYVYIATSLFKSVGKFVLFFVQYLINLCFYKTIINFLKKIKKKISFCSKCYQGQLLQ